MSDAKHEKRSHFRGKSRPGRRIEIRYRRVGEALAVGAQTRNIGVGGAFVLTPQALAMGTPVELELHVPTSADPIKVTGEVRWVVPPEDDPEFAGMGIKFLHLNVEALLRLSDYFASLTGIEEPGASTD